MSKINRYEDLIVNHYTNSYIEDERFTKLSKRIEYLTTMRYIQKFAKIGCKILEIGAATGVYSVELAKMGYDVTAIDLTPSNVEVMKQKSKGLSNIKCMVGDALNLSMLEDNTFDLVLNLGPMYHLFSVDDKMQAISETLRVCKTNGVCMFAYITHSSIVWNYGVRKGNMKEFDDYLLEGGIIKDTPKEIFSSYHIEDFNNQFKKSNSTFITNVATDSLFPIMTNYIDNGVMTEDDYNRLVNWHFETCERLDHQGLSGHMLYICQKN